MSTKYSEDAVAFGYGDPTVVNGFTTYESKDFDELKKYFYAVMMHGDVQAVDVYGGLDPFKFAPILIKCYEQYGKGRAILLVSCMVGWAFARPLARNVKLPIVAGLSKVSFQYQTDHGVSKHNLAVLDDQGLKLQQQLTPGSTIPAKFKPEWVFYHPSGQVETLPGGCVLNQKEAINRAKQYVHD